MFNMFNVEDAMLGLRLDRELEAGLARVARQSHRSKSDVAREAIRQYLDRRFPQAEIDRQLALIAAANAGDQAMLDDMHAMQAETLQHLPAPDPGE